MLVGLLWVMAPTAVFGLLVLAMPAPDPPPRWRAAVGRCAAWLRGRWRALRPPRVPPPDPFEVLRLQLRLGVLAEQIRALENDPAVWARARRLHAAWGAYDGLLRDACVLAGVEVADTRPVLMPVRDDGERFREEIELASRGWSW